MRIAQTNPLQPAYRMWLSTVPWQPGKPLPLGPMHLVSQDLVVLGALAGLTFYAQHWISWQYGLGIRTGLAALGVLVFFGVPYLYSLLSSFFRARLRREAFILAMGPGLVVRSWPHISAMLGALVLLYIVGHVGIRRLLALYPWEQPQKRIRPSQLGWPSNALDPRAESVRIRPSSQLLIAIVIGWSAYVGAWVFMQTQSLLGDQQELLATQVVLSAGIVASINRLIVHVVHQVPIGLRARLSTGRLIIPSYDRAFLPPLFIVAIGPSACWLLIQAGASASAAFGAAIGLIFLAAVALPPSLREWKLTAEGRSTRTGLELVGGMQDQPKRK